MRSRGTQWQAGECLAGASGLAVPRRLVVGIPTRNEVATVGAVTATVDRGLSEASPTAASVIVNADNGSADGTREVSRSVPTRAQDHD